ncbi:MAG TPA: hypothetical protein VF518_07980 [Polyangia bacterium]
MLRLSRCALFTLLFAWGCAKSPEPSGNDSGGAQPSAGSRGGSPSSGSAGTTGSSGGSTASGGRSSQGGTTSSGSGGTTGSSGGTTAASSSTPSPDDFTPGPASSCNATTGQGNLSSQYQRAHVTCNGKDYVVQNNAWGSSAGQTVTYGPGTKFKVTVQNGTGNNGAPASYPSLYIGDNGGEKSTGGILPKPLSSMGKVPTAWTWAANGATGDYNAAYDVWFSTSNSGDNSSSMPSGGYLMVWFYKPLKQQPIGQIIAVGDIGGKSWNIWFGNNSNGKPCISYVAAQALNSLSFDLNMFIKDAIARGKVQSSWSLTNVFAGFEIWSGGVGLETTDFAVTVP